MIFKKADQCAARNPHESLEVASRRCEFKISDDDPAFSVQSVGPHLGVEAQVQSTFSELRLTHPNQVGLEADKIHGIECDLRRRISSGRPDPSNSLDAAITPHPLNHTRQFKMSLGFQPRDGYVTDDAIDALQAGFERWPAHSGVEKLHDSLLHRNF